MLISSMNFSSDPNTSPHASAVSFIQTGIQLLKHLMWGERNTDGGEALTPSYN